MCRFISQPCKKEVYHLVYAEPCSLDSCSLKRLYWRCVRPAELTNPVVRVRINRSPWSRALAKAKDAIATAPHAFSRISNHTSPVSRSSDVASNRDRGSSDISCISLEIRNNAESSFRVPGGTKDVQGYMHEYLYVRVVPSSILDTLLMATAMVI